MSRSNPYAVFSNYNGNNPQNNPYVTSAYKNYNQMDQSQSVPTQQPNDSVKPLATGVRPTPRPHGDQSLPQYPMSEQPIVQTPTQHPSQFESSYPTPPHPAMPHRVRDIESEKLHMLLTDHSYHFTPNNTPLKILVKVYTDWCKPCQIIAPRIEEMSNDPEFSDILFVQINAEKISESLRPLINVSAVPVFFGFVAGKKIDFIPGPDMAKIVEMCKRMNSIMISHK